MGNDRAVSGDRRYLPSDWVLPKVDELNQAFFSGGLLRLERCTVCRAIQHPPIGVCAACRSVELDRVATEPIGAIVSYTVVHHPVHPMLAEAVPYNVIVVALDEYPEVRIVGNLLDAVSDRLQVGARVVGAWTAAIESDVSGSEVRLLQWRLTG